MVNVPGADVITLVSIVVTVIALACKYELCKRGAGSGAYARACACTRVRVSVRTCVRTCACVHVCTRACVVGHGTALHGLYGVLCIVAMQGSVRGALTRRRALNPRAGVTMHDAYGNIR